MSEQISNCEKCQKRYHVFRRPKQCNLCGLSFCSKCLLRSAASTKSRACATCLLIVNDRTTRDQLEAIRVRHLRAYLVHSKIVSVNRLQACLEKQDLINLIEWRKQQTPDETYVFVERPTGTVNDESITRNSSNQPPTEESPVDRSEEIPTITIAADESTAEPMVDPAPPPPIPVGRKTLAGLSSLESIHVLTVGQLKDILNQNFVSYKGCVEKNELIGKLERLYRDKQQQNQTDMSTSEENLCKICMDAHIDCVFLDCGHLCTCVQCGKRLAECPLCRAYIVRVVRVFRS